MKEGNLNGEVVNEMNKFGIQIEVPEGEVKALLDKLTEAQETILNCYYELDRLGVLTIKEKTASDN